MHNFLHSQFPSVKKHKPHWPKEDSVSGQQYLLPLYTCLHAKEGDLMQGFLCESPQLSSNILDLSPQWFYLEISVSTYNYMNQIRYVSFFRNGLSSLHMKLELPSTALSWSQSTSAASFWWGSLSRNIQSPPFIFCKVSSRGNFFQTYNYLTLSRRE